MKPLGAIRALWAGRRDDARRIQQLTELNQTLRQEVRDLRGTVRQLTEKMTTLQRRADLLTGVQQEDSESPARLARAAAALDAGRVTTHVRAAVARAVLSREPVPNLTVEQALPPDLYDTVLDTLRSRAFSPDSIAGGKGMKLPPRIAPLAATVIWQFVVDQAVGANLIPALLERFEVNARQPLSVEATFRLSSAANEAPSGVAAVERRLVVSMSLARRDIDTGSGLRPNSAIAWLAAANAGATMTVSSSGHPIAEFSSKV